MTCKGYGLKLAELTREKLPDGRPDPSYTGRILRIVPESGGEIVLQLSASAVKRLKDLLSDGLESLKYSGLGWENHNPPQCRPLDAVSVPGMQTGKITMA